MITIEVKISDYRTPGSWKHFMDADSEAEAASILRHLRAEHRQEVADGLVGRFERWEYRIAPKQAKPVIRCIRRK